MPHTVGGVVVGATSPLHRRHALHFTRARARTLRMDSIRYATDRWMRPYLAGSSDRSPRMVNVLPDPAPGAVGAARTVRRQRGWGAGHRPGGPPPPPPPPGPPPPPPQKCATPHPPVWPYAKTHDDRPRATWSTMPCTREKGRGGGEVACLQTRPQPQPPPPTLPHPRARLHGGGEQLLVGAGAREHLVELEHVRAAPVLLTQRDLGALHRDDVGRLAVLRHVGAHADEHVHLHAARHVQGGIARRHLHNRSAGAGGASGARFVQPWWAHVERRNPADPRHECPTLLSTCMERVGAAGDAPPAPADAVGAGVLLRALKEGDASPLAPAPVEGARRSDMVQARGWAASRSCCFREFGPPSAVAGSATTALNAPGGPPPPPPRPRPPPGAAAGSFAPVASTYPRLRQD
jgi:hypothetical protein